MDPLFSECDTVVLCDGQEVDEEDVKQLDDSDEWERVGFIDIYEFVTPCFTQKAADEYIAGNKHNLTDPRVYVESAHRNREWQYIREALMNKGAIA